MILDVARCYLYLFTLYINIKWVKIVVGCCTGRWPPVCVFVCVWGGGVVVRLAVACDVCDGVFLCCLFFHEVSWMRS